MSRRPTILKRDTPYQIGEKCPNREWYEIPKLDELSGLYEEDCLIDPPHPPLRLSLHLSLIIHLNDEDNEDDEDIEDLEIEIQIQIQIQI